ncbi:Peroxisomal membrane signal receptor PTS1 [Naganishia albida]|nr:Peroxisomal membrane signal receptor PTS1 [Naganishia albida]
MQSFLGGADCAANANPLSGMLKREAVDRSVLRDRTESPIAGSSRTSDPGFRATPLQGGFTPRQHAQQQQGQQQQQHQQQQSFERAFANAMTLSQQQQGPAGPSMLMRSQAPPPPMMMATPPPMMQPMMGQGQQQQQGPHAWGGDFQAFVDGKGKAREASPQMQQMQQQQPAMTQYTPQMGYSPYVPRFQPLSHTTYAPQPFQHQQQPAFQPPAVQEQVDTAKLDAEFERALAEHRELEAAQKEDRRGAEKDAAVADDGELQSALAQPREGDGQPDFEAVWQSLKPEADRLGKLAEWEKEFSQFANGQQDDELDYDFNPDMTGAVQEPSFGVNGRQVGEDGYPLLGDYEFAQENPHTNNHQSLKQALHILSTGGSLTEAALLLEAALASGTAAAQASQLSESGGQTLLAGGEAAVWTLLGQTQAMDEKETSAVRALEEGRKRFEADKGRSELADRTFGEGLVSLAISYTNESYDYSALLALHRYLSLLHPSYAGPVPSSDLDMDMLDPETHDIPNPWHANQRLTESYLALARDQITAGVVDADVQVGLGVLYYQTGEFERARDCWVAALGVRPTDFQLWNRLGATLANSGSPEEAIDAYRRALELKPSFTRAIYNLGVSCLNIGVFQEAAEHLLAGLALHAVDASAVPAAKLGNGADAPDHSTTLWTTLRRVFQAMERPDLVDMAKPGTDLNVFRQAGFEF